MQLFLLALLVPFALLVSMLTNFTVSHALHQNALLAQLDTRYQLIRRAARTAFVVLIIALLAKTTKLAVLAARALP